MGPIDPRPVTTDTLFNAFSVTKAVTATAIHMLVADQRIPSYDTPVVEIWPKFGDGGGARKRRITVAHVLAHTSGLASAGPTDNSPQGFGDWPAVKRAMELAEPATEPGE